MRVAARYRAQWQPRIAWADHNGEDWYRAEFVRMKGELILRRSNTSLAIEAENCFRLTGETARDQGALFWELRAALGVAGLRMAQGRHDEVRQILAPVYDRFTEGFDIPDLCAARALMDGSLP